MNSRLQEITALFYRIFLVYLFYSITRFLFIYFNNDLLNIVTLRRAMELNYYGIRFDSTSIVYLNIIFIFFSIIPWSKTTSKNYQIVLFWTYFLFNGLGIALQFIDFVYYRYNLNRLMSNFMEVIEYEENKADLIVHFLGEYYYLILLFLTFMILWKWLYDMIPIIPEKILNSKNYIIMSIIFFLSVITLSIMGARGGDLKKSTRPITIIDAMNNVDNPIHADIILNTPFTIIRTLNHNEFKKRNFFEKEDVFKVLSPIKQYDKINNIPKPNIIIFILESMGREYWGSMNERKSIPNYISYTPFLDSLANHSLVFTNSFATSRKSIHGMPSILAGIPSFKVSYASSRYSKQKIQSIVSIANELNYKTSFFHGAENGSMGFLGFSNTLGFQKYYGRKEFNNDKEYDGFWGIWDEPFLQFMKLKLDEMETPFLSTVFTITSHEPYIIPKIYKEKFNKGELEMHQCVEYTDFAIKKFFEKSKETDWFNNTIFIFTADHGNQTFYPFYKKTINQFANPLMIYKPNSNLIGKDNRLTSHLDIYPTIVNLLGYENPFRSWGKSLINDNYNDSFVINYFGADSYFIMNEKYICVHDGTKAIGFYNIEDKNLETNLISKRNIEMNELEKKCSVFLQDYFNRIISNEM
ncbi:MAG: sulfatase-like hydrolase/transferase [Flavobacteriaceae bacterium]|nr:sulfatase-like hydrolase/transferase [Flavobacteriaceae bacterium]